MVALLVNKKGSHYSDLSKRDIDELQENAFAPVSSGVRTLVGDEGVSSTSQNLENRESVVSTIAVWLTEDSVDDEGGSLGLNFLKIAQPKMVFQHLESCLIPVGTLAT